MYSMSLYIRKRLDSLSIGSRRESIVLNGFVDKKSVQSHDSVTCILLKSMNSVPYHGISDNTVSKQQACFSSSFLLKYWCLVRSTTLVTFSHNTRSCATSICALTMGCSSSIFATNTNGPMKFSTQYCRIIQRYMPHFVFDEASQEADRKIAFAHWEQIYHDTIHSDHTAADSPVGKLYAAFYNYLFEHSPYMKQLFQANQSVQSRVLTHISTGMKSLLHSEDLVQKVMHLALLHMKIGVAATDFDPLGEALIQAMKQTSGAAWSVLIETAWRRIYCHASILILVNIPNVHIDVDGGNHSEEPN